MSSIERIERVAILAKPSFFCAGVNWGIEHLKQDLKEHGRIYIPNINGLVHYPPVTEELRGLGAVFVEDPRDIPTSSWVGNSMHGLSPLDRQTYIDRQLQHIDYSCPLVINVGQRVLGAIRTANQEGKVAKILYACKDVTHPEPKAVLELAPSHVIPVTDRSILEEYQVRTEEMYFAESQTTINVKESVEMIMAFTDKFRGLRSLLPTRLGACFATDNRQQALNALIKTGVDRLVVIGSTTSANTTQLAKIGKSHGIPVDFLERAHDLSLTKFDGVNRVGITGGASVPPQEGDIAKEIFRQWGFKTADLVTGKPEPTTFPNINPPFYDYRSGKITPEILKLTRTY